MPKTENNIQDTLWVIRGSEHICKLHRMMSWDCTQQGKTDWLLSLPRLCCVLPSECFSLVALQRILTRLFDIIVFLTSGGGWVKASSSWVSMGREYQSPVPSSSCCTLELSLSGDFDLIVRCKSFVLQIERRRLWLFNSHSPLSLSLSVKWLESPEQNLLMTLQQPAATRISGFLSAQGIFLKMSKV